MERNKGGDKQLGGALRKKNPALTDQNFSGKKTGMLDLLSEIKQRYYLFIALIDSLLPQIKLSVGVRD